MPSYFDNEKRNLTPDNGKFKFQGEQRIEDVTIRAVVYNEKDYNERILDDFSECQPFDKSSVTWVNITGLHDADKIGKIGKCIGLHPLLIEDILHPEHLPKIDYSDDYIFIILKILNYYPEKEEVGINHLSIILGEDYLVSFLEVESKMFEDLKEKLKSRKSRITRLAADYLNYSIIDMIVDRYGAVLHQTSEDIETLEDMTLGRIDHNLLLRIQRLKRNLQLIRKYVIPLKEVIRNMEIDDSSLTRDSNDPYLKDLYDHIVQVIDTIEIQRERLAEITTLYLTATSNKLNEIMKVLTIISTIFIPLTFISSIYGMNFKYMPELSTPWGYPLVLILMFAIGYGMFIYFKRKKWF